MLKKIFFAIFFITVFFALPQKAEAVKFSLIAPSGQLGRGQDIQFTININTEDTTVTSQQIGITYETQYLQYVSTAPGQAMNSVTVSDQGGGKLLLTGTNNAGFSGTGSFAIVTLKIIATSAGSTKLCALWAPVITNTPLPTNPPIIQPTALPRTGSFNKMVNLSIIAFVFVVEAGSIFYLNQRGKYEKPHKKKINPKLKK